MFEAKVIAASAAEGCPPIYTLQVTAPKFVDAEFEKHRMLSSNSSSSRALRLKRDEHPYYPLDLRKEQKGMQGYEPVSLADADRFREELEFVYDHLYGTLVRWSNRIHKQHLNRYLEPFRWQTKVVTATEWDNFFRLRTAPDAQPEIRRLAFEMKAAIANAEPKMLKPGEWHHPYVSDKEFADVGMHKGLMLSAARCARTSYNAPGKSGARSELELAGDLLKSQHMTPFEHQATPMHSPKRPSSAVLFNEGISHIDKHLWAWSGNFRGWIQYRKQIEDANYE